MVDVRNGGGEASSFRAVNQANSEPARDHDHDPDQSGALKVPAAAEDVPSSKASSKAPSTRTSTPAAASSDLRQPAQASSSTPSALEQPPQSQPMTATTSNSSHEARFDLDRWNDSRRGSAALDSVESDYTDGGAGGGAGHHDDPATAAANGVH